MNINKTEVTTWQKIQTQVCAPMSTRASLREVIPTRVETA